MIYLLAFGNPYLEDDNLALEIADRIIAEKVKGVEVIKCVSPEEVIQYTDRPFYILDVVKDLDKILIFEDIDRLKANNIVSMHDFDLGFFLKLMKETGKIESVKIIGIPQKGDTGKITEEVIKILEKNIKK